MTLSALLSTFHPALVALATTVLLQLAKRASTAVDQLSPTTKRLATVFIASALTATWQFLGIDAPTDLALVTQETISTAVVAAFASMGIHQTSRPTKS